MHGGVFNKMENGDAALAPYYAGDFLTMYDVNPDLAFCYPKEGVNFFVDAMCVPKNAENKEAADKFVKGVDSSSVYVNVSTRFTDGEEFGFGAEIGISTQKLHARGPMGLKALTTVKYIITGNGQIR